MHIKNVKEKYANIDEIKSRYFNNNSHKYFKLPTKENQKDEVFYEDMIES